MGNNVFIGTKSELSLDAVGIGDETAETLSAELATNSTLKHLSLAKNLITEKGATCIAKALTVNSSLVSLNLSENNLHLGTAKILAETLLTNTTLTSLSIDKTAIGDDGLIRLAEALSVNTSLQTLSVLHNNIGVPGARMLAGTLRVNTGLTAVNLGSNQISEEGMQALSQALLANPLGKLRSLNLHSNNIGCEANFVDLVGNTSLLTNLNLYNNNLGPEAGGALVEALKFNNSLVVLNLNRNQLGDDAAHELATCVATNNSLTILSLAANKIGPEAITHIIEALRVNSKIVTLNLGVNKFGPETTSTLCEVLRTNTTLTDLMIEGNQIGNKGAGKIFEALAENKTLISLNIDRNGIDHAGALSIAQSLENNDTLTKLILDTAGFPEDLVHRIAGKVVWNKESKLFKVKVENQMPVQIFMQRQNSLDYGLVSHEEVNHLDLQMLDTKGCEDQMAELIQNPPENVNVSRFPQVRDDVKKYVHTCKLNNTPYNTEGSYARALFYFNWNLQFENQYSHPTVFNAIKQPKSEEDLDSDSDSWSYTTSTTRPSSLSSALDPNSLHAALQMQSNLGKSKGTGDESGETRSRGSESFSTSLGSYSIGSFSTSTGVTTSPTSTNPRDRDREGNNTNNANNANATNPRANPLPRAPVTTFQQPGTRFLANQHGGEACNFYYQLNKALMERSSNRTLVHFSGYLYYFQKALSIVPNYTGYVYRCFNEYGKDVLIENYRLGRVIQCGSYVASTVDLQLVKYVCGSGGIIVKYHVNNGKHVARYNPLPLATEVLLSPNMRFVVSKAPYRGKDGFYYTKVVQIIQDNFVF